MQKKSLPFLFTMGLALCTPPMMAETLSRDMKTLSGTLRTVEQSTDPVQLKDALNVMRAAAQKAQGKTPRKLRGYPQQSPEMQQYRHTYDRLIQQIDEALIYVEQGQIDDAKKVVNNLKITRDLAHKTYR
ncbi:soluble cytochrome b562 [Providencia alcalifaciens]|uniref:Soluble cytochrome b562 n=1 Tax=Providencia alcalifaciens TaxID=126385 RepID=A0A4R3ND19_9GAMM|nr:MULTISPECIES: cytochrome b562 [Providencia]MBC5792275.1 cytochrome b562 [Providencia sp. JUb39]TCT28163.1 soluble cytochrome b562 [Providencia alcalifaciens]